MNEPQKKSDYSDLMGKISLENIITTRMDFSLAGKFDPAQKKYDAKVDRSPVDLKITEKNLFINVAYRIRGISGEDEIFQSHFVFMIIFKHKDKDEISVLTENEKIKKILTTSQTDKLVWSYLRRSLLQVVTDAGLPPIILPLYK
jgi:preprotein translocase subunit SecB